MKKTLLLLNYGHVKKVFTNNRIQAGFNSARRKKAKSTKNKSNAQSEKYSPLWKCSKLFIPPQTDGIIHFAFNIGCSESKVIFK